MAQIFRILVLCPITRQALDTGIRTSGREVLNSDIYGGGKIYCRLCGGMHSLDEAFPEISEDRSLQETWRPNAG
jgi:hypothetical protein